MPGGPDGGDHEPDPVPVRQLVLALREQLAQPTRRMAEPQQAQPDQPDVVRRRVGHRFSEIHWSRYSSSLPIRRCQVPADLLLEPAADQRDPDGHVDADRVAGPRTQGLDAVLAAESGGSVVDVGLPGRGDRTVVVVGKRPGVHLHDDSVAQEGAGRPRDLVLRQLAGTPDDDEVVGRLDLGSPHAAEPGVAGREVGQVGDRGEQVRGGERVVVYESHGETLAAAGRPVLVRSPVAPLPSGYGRAA